jgi:hypothetical protein
MYFRNLFYLVYVALLFTTTYGLTKDEVLSLESGQYYCKDDICASLYDDDLATVTIPNKQGQNTTYIVDTCTTINIELNNCPGRNCSNDSECLSNKCMKGHCAFNEDNPVVHCQYVCTNKEAPLFSMGDSKGYVMRCGLPFGASCHTDNECSSFNCEKSRLCGHEKDSGCHSSFVIRQILFFCSIIFIIFLILACIVCYKKIKSQKQ